MFRLIYAPGDGIGPEVSAQALSVFKLAADRLGLSYSVSEVPIGGISIDRCGVPLSDEAVSQILSADAVLLGAVGGSKWDTLPPGIRPERGLLRLRKDCDAYANLRPSKIYPCLRDASPLKPELTAKGIDILIVRELSGGIYFGNSGENEFEAFDEERYTVPEIRRILIKGFESARLRRCKLTLVDKANVLTSSRLWRRVCREIAPEYPEVEVGYMYVDNAAMQLCCAPYKFDTIVTSNLFGDILSDEASVISGSIGMLPSASLGRVNIYEPIHGSAPDIAGKNVANPCGAILSVAMLFRYSLGSELWAARIETAVDSALNAGLRTADLGAENPVSTSEMGGFIINELSKQ